MKQNGFAPIFIIVIGLVLLGSLGGGGYYLYNQQKLRSVSDFESCAKLYPVLTSYPGQCNTPDGRHFVQLISVDKSAKTLSEAPAVTQNSFTVSVLDTSNWVRFEDQKYSFLHPSAWAEYKNISSIGTTIAAFDFNDGVVLEHVSLVTESDDYLETLMKSFPTLKFTVGDVQGTLVERTFSYTTGTTYAYDYVFYKGINGYDFTISSGKSLRESEIEKQLLTLIASFQEKSIVQRSTPSPTPVPLTYEQCIERESNISKNTNRQYVKGELLVGFKSLSLDQSKKIIENYGLTIKNAIDIPNHVNLQVGVVVGQEIKWMCTLKANLEIENVELNETFSIGDCSKGPC